VNIYFALVGVGIVAISMSVCLFVCSHTLKLHVQTSQILLYVLTVAQSFFYDKCNTLCTSSFVVDIMFLHKWGQLGRIKDGIVLSSSLLGGIRGAICCLQLPCSTVTLMPFNMTLLVLTTLRVRQSHTTVQSNQTSYIDLMLVRSDV